ncbi:Dod ND5 i3 grp IB protein [Tuber indicum]|nr:Dod ND5 i3 grp IB protein [Tuber indicum]
MSEAKGTPIFVYDANMQFIDFFPSANAAAADYRIEGLIEGDGSIAVHDKNSKSQQYRPKIIVAFHLTDKPLAERLAFITQSEDVIRIINIINGYFRTPKIEALHHTSPINSNAWLAGFADADGDRKKNAKITGKRVQVFFRIEVRQNYHRNVTELQGGASYFNILTNIARFLAVNLYTRSREQKDKVFYSFTVVSHNTQSHQILRNYFDKFPLYSSKYLAYKDWCEVLDLMKENTLTIENLDKIKAIKAQFNSKRKVFDFSHLNSLKFII